MEKNLLKTRVVIILIAVVAIAALLIGIVSFSSGGTSAKLKKQLDLGQKYLAELDYERAVTAFKEGLIIDPKSEDASEGLMAAIIGWNDQTYDSGDHDKAYSILEEAIDYYTEFLESNTSNEGAYKGIIECYIRLGDLDSAKYWAEKGVDELGTDTLKELLDKINSDSIKSLSSRVIKSTRRNADGEIMYWILHHYVDGKETVTHYDASDNVIDEWYPEYDENGHEIVSYSHNEDGKLVAKIVTTYDGDLYVRNDHYYLSDGRHTYTLYEYDSENRVVSETDYNERDEKVHYCIREYSSNGYTRTMYSTHSGMTGKEVCQFGPDGKTVTFITYYDKDGNMTGTWENE